MMPSRGSCFALVLSCALSTWGCGSSDEGQGGGADAGAGGSGGQATSSGGAGASSGGATSSGGSSGSTGSGGTQSSGGNTGSGGAVLPVGECSGSTDWADVTSPQIEKLGGKAAQSYPGGASGVVVNRLTGDVMVHFVGFGIWKSSDTGANWTRIDGNTIDESGGRCETGWGVQVDQDDPARMAVFTLDGTAGYTTNGKDWKKWTAAPWYRGWDYGSVDWSSPEARTIIAVEHEKPSQTVVLSTDGGATWKELTTIDVPFKTAGAMVGAIDSKTLIASNGAGIMRSTDQGATWNKVSDAKPASRVPVRFNGTFYLGTSDALLVSGDGGATWQRQGTAIAGNSMLSGPYFGADEKTMVVGVNTSTDLNAGASSIYKTTDGGEHWTKVSDTPPSSSEFPFNYTWFGSMAWDPVHDAFYTTAMSNPAFRRCAD